MRRTLVSFAVTAATVLALPLATTVPVFAAGVEYPDNGTIAIGRGGAWAANPSDGLAFQYNPAGLAQQHGFQVLIDTRYAWQHMSFTSTSIPGSARIENDAPPFLGPSGAISYGVGAIGPLSELTFAIGATGPSSIGKSRYPDLGAQRYALRNTDYFIGYYSAAVAAGIGKWVRVGVTGQLARGTAKFNQAVYSGLGKADDPTYETKPYFDPKNDTDATFSGKSGWIPAAVFGVTVLPHQGLAVGLSYRPSVRFDAPGTLVTVPPKFARDQGIETVGTGAELHLDFAGTMRAGIAWDVSPRLQVELDGVWERWSVLQNLVIETKDIFVKHPYSGPNGEPPQPVRVPSIVFPHYFHDTVSGRLGGDYDLIPGRFRARAGYLYETSAADTKYVSVDFANWARHVVSVGGSVRLYGAWLDFAYAHHFVATQNVTDSAVMQQVTPKLAESFPPASVPSVVGNGTYTAGMDILSVSLRLPWNDLNVKF
jgi:long-subunit fatty acid transport protein